MTYLTSHSNSTISLAFGNLFPLPSFSEVSSELTKAKRIWHEKGTSAVLLFEAQLQWLEQHYVFREGKAVHQILRRYPLLVQLLIDTYGKIETYFSAALVFLEVTVNFETSDGYSEMMGDNEELVVFISTHLSPKEAVETLEIFYDNWWLEASKNVIGKISIGLECL